MDSAATDAPTSVVDPQPSPRRPWLAALLSLGLIGLGQLYSGRPLRALVVWLSSMAVGVAGLTIAVFVPGVGQLILLFVALLAPILLSAADAWLCARTASVAYVPRSYNRWYIYAGLFLFSALVWQPFFKSQLTGHIANTYRIPSGSMEPTLLVGDYLFAVPLRRPIMREQLVTYRTGAGAFAKRVVGLPGDTLAMRAGILSVNGHSVAEPYAQRDSADPTWPEFAWQRAYILQPNDSANYYPTLQNWGPLVVPAHEYFILGDNRGSSLDSRFGGFISERAFIGIPRAVYFSRDAERGRIRWERLGHSLTQ